jgi:hypothetical protein
MKNIHVLIPVVAGLAITAFGFLYYKNQLRKKRRKDMAVADTVRPEGEIEINQKRNLNGKELQIGWKYCKTTDTSFGCIRIKDPEGDVKDVLFEISDCDSVFASSAIDSAGNIYCVGARFTKTLKPKSNPIVVMFDKDYNIIRSKVIEHPKKKAESLSIVSFAEDTQEIIGVGIGSANSKSDCLCVTVLDRDLNITELNLYPQPTRNIGDFI